MVYFRRKKFYGLNSKEIFLVIKNHKFIQNIFNQCFLVSYLTFQKKLNKRNKQLELTVNLQIKGKYYYDKLFLKNKNNFKLKKNYKILLIDNKRKYLEILSSILDTIFQKINILMRSNHSIYQKLKFFQKNKQIIWQILFFKQFQKKNNLQLQITYLSSLFKNNIIIQLITKLIIKKNKSKLQSKQIMTLETYEDKAKDLLKNNKNQKQAGIQQYYFHKKKKEYGENNKKEKESKTQIKQVNHQHLYYHEIMTDLTPNEIQYLIQQKADNDQNYCPEQLDDYSFKITQHNTVIDFDYDEETDELIELKVQQKSQYYLQILKISNLENMYTVKFQNITKQYDIEFQNIKNDFQEYLKKF
ncbi:hypothetical protein ABPG72_014178 [Tetrahymena utriculariae]